MIPWKSIIKFSKPAQVPVYAQVANSIIREIKSGVLKPGLQLPATRALSSMLRIHRKTVVAAYAELDAQGWIITRAYKGSFINNELPEKSPVKFGHKGIPSKEVNATGYPISSNLSIHTPAKTYREMPGFHDGPDVRLVPVDVISKAYRNVLLRKSSIHNLSYVDVQGKMQLRTYLAEDMNLNRGMNTTPENILITRGSQMAIYLLSMTIFAKNDLVIVGEVDYYYACKAFANAGAKLVRVKIDDDGINVDQVEQICKKKKIRAVYVTSHHHYPTTITLSASRRMKLLHLAEKYRFVIIEDDYDYELHYLSNPVLPIASADEQSMVIYLGTFSKTIAPAIRIGYVVAPVNLILEMTKLRQIIDVQGDPLMEQVIAELFHSGEIRRHMKKALKIYKQRRDLMCSMLSETFDTEIEFKIPDGGLAIWAKYHKKIDLPDLSQKLKARGIVLSPGLIHNPSPDVLLNSTRMGFGWMSAKEAEKAVCILKEVIHSTFSISNISIP